MTATATVPNVDTAALVQRAAAARRAALTRRLDDQVEREADDRQSRLLAGIPDFDRWPLSGFVAEVAIATRRSRMSQ